MAKKLLFWKSTRPIDYKLPFAAKLAANPDPGGIDRNSSPTSIYFFFTIYSVEDRVHAAFLEKQNAAAYGLAGWDYFTV